MNLSQSIDQYRNAQFQYGVLDCCLFVANVLQAVTGRDYAAPWRGRYHTETGALRMIAKHGDLAGIASAAFGKRKHILFVKPGDPVLLPHDLVEHDQVNDALGIYDGESIVYLTERGLAKGPVLAGICCWNIPHV